jgi:uncharacterized protein (DUF1778 family)
MPGRGTARAKRTPAAEKMDRIDLRVTREQKRTLARAAALSGASISSFLLRRAMDEAKEVVSRSESLLLSDRDRDRFFALLENPPRPNRNLVKLMRDRRR